MTFALYIIFKMLLHCFSERSIIVKYFISLTSFCCFASICKGYLPVFLEFSNFSTYILVMTIRVCSIIEQFQIFKIFSVLFSWIIVFSICFLALVSFFKELLSAICWVFYMLLSHKSFLPLFFVTLIFPFYLLLLQVIINWFIHSYTSSRLAFISEILFFSCFTYKSMIHF